MKRRTFTVVLSTTEQLDAAEFRERLKDLLDSSKTVPVEIVDVQTGDLLEGVSQDVK